LTILLDALAALRLLEKRGEHYSLAPGVENALTRDSDQTVLAMAQHQANCLRNWAQLAWVVKTGKPAPDIPSVRGESGDQEAFIGAMHNVSAPVADAVIQALQPLHFRHLLDVGGGSGTWTMTFLRGCPGATATIFDLPHVINMARQRLGAAGFLDRVRLAEGSFYDAELPPGADLAWVSAIVHQNSREQNRDLFAKVFRALEPGGRIAVRDILMQLDRTQPVAGALFAVNMLVATEGGSTFTLDELREDLEATGFKNVAVARTDEGMNAIVVAKRRT
jgi:precorrin-6B methylase 2